MENKMLLLKLGALQKQFESEFSQCWNNFITKCDHDMAMAKQLNIGNHTRPFLVYLGATANSNFDNLSLFKETAQLAVSIEAIHKASVIIDDIIDGDSLRRGEKCMHNEFGEYETVFFAVCMLSRGIENVNQMLSTTKKVETLHTSVISLLCDTIYSMCHGAIMEISSDIQKQTDLKHIQEIISSETIKLIENSLYIGLLYSGSVSGKSEKDIRNIGQKCGYIFQVMNDLEAFCNPQHIILYKGNLNSDFLRSRKNIILPYLYHSCSKADKKKLLELLGGDELCFSKVQVLFEKYQIKRIILEDINDIYNSLFTKLIALNAEISNKQWTELFTAYLVYTKTKYQAILNPS